MSEAVQMALYMLDSYYLHHDSDFHCACCAKNEGTLQLPMSKREQVEFNAPPGTVQVILEQKWYYSLNKNLKCH